MSDGSPSTAFARYLRSYRRYARRRGFRGPLDDAAFFWRAFLVAWTEPGFHRFWRTWNPGISYFVHRVYLRLGGSRRPDLATIGAFLACGVAHNIVTLPWFQRWSWTLPTAFLLFGLATVASRRLARRLRQDRWPLVLNTAISVGLVVLGFDLGFRVDAAL